MPSSREYLEHTQAEGELRIERSVEPKLRVEERVVGGELGRWGRWWRREEPEV